MRRILLVLAVAALVAVMMAVSQAAWAADGPVGPTRNDHNCGGTSSFNSIQDGGGQDFGTAVGGFASSGEDIPTFTAADCVPHGTWPPQPS